MHVLFKVDGRPLHVRALGAEREPGQPRQRQDMMGENGPTTRQETVHRPVSPPEGRGLALAPLGLRPLSWRRMRCAYSGGPSAALHTVESRVESVAQCGDLVWAEAVDELSKCLSVERRVGVLALRCAPRGKQQGAQ